MKKELDFLVYTTPQSEEKVKVFVQGEMGWLTQKAMADLFGVKTPAISKHLKNIFAEGELDEKVAISILETTSQHGAMSDKTQNNQTMFYNLDAIISVGYRVNSSKATAFRIWATTVLREYMQKGFVVDDDRLKQGETLFGKDYFRELLERVRSIRASERRIWLQITDIFAECSIDYDKNADFAHEFYASIQNKFHYAITGQTAAEIIYDSADSTKENMGLTTWKNAPSGRVLKSDVTIAKNYLQLNDIRRLEREVSAFFDYVERLIEDERAFTMKEFVTSVNEFLAFRRFNVLKHNGRVTRDEAHKKAIAEYDIFNKTQRITSDFDRLLLKAKGDDDND